MSRFRHHALPAGLLFAIGWLATPAGASTSTAVNPTVTFATPGTRTISLQVCNGNACTTKSQQVTVLDPAPVITSATTDGLVTLGVNAEVGQLVHLAGAGTGKPQLSFTWNVLAGLQTVATIPGAVAGQGDAWWDTSGFAPGIYKVFLHLANPVGAIDSPPFFITLLPEQPLVFYTLTPCRLLDTRGTGALTSDTTSTFDVLAVNCGVPTNARALALNVTVVGATSSGTLTVFPGNYPTPSTNVVAFAAGATRAVSTVAAISPAGATTVAARATLANGGTVHLVLDVAGYFAPEPAVRPAKPRWRRPAGKR